MEDQHREHYESRRLQWQKMYENALHSDRIAADIGIYVLKVLLVVTGGAIVALLSFLASDSIGTSETRTIIADALDEFLWSLLLAMGASGIAYFYQSFVTRNEWEKFNKEFDEDYKKNKWPELGVEIAKWPMLLLAFLSFAFFCYASFGLIGDFQAMVSVCGK